MGSIPHGNLTMEYLVILLIHGFVCLFVVSGDGLHTCCANSLPLNFTVIPASQFKWATAMVIFVVLITHSDGSLWVGLLSFAWAFSIKIFPCIFLWGG